MFDLKIHKKNSLLKRKKKVFSRHIFYIFFHVHIFYITCFPYYSLQKGEESNIYYTKLSCIWVKEVIVYWTFDLLTYNIVFNVLSILILIFWILFLSFWCTYYYMLWCYRCFTCVILNNLVIFVLFLVSSYFSCGIVIFMCFRKHVWQYLNWSLRIQSLSKLLLGCFVFLLWNKRFCH